MKKENMIRHQRRRTSALPALLLLLVPAVGSELIRTFEVKEGSPIGSIIGVIGESRPGLPQPPQPPYLIVPLPGSSPDTDLIINQQTGEIRTKKLLDREATSAYELSAIALNGENVKVVINVIDINDNAPVFAEKVVTMNIPENIPRETRRKLVPARDRDLGVFNTQRYEIVSGNEKEAFRLEYSRDREGVLDLDLVVQDLLDREVQDSYSLEILAADGGSPPRSSSLTVEVNIQDLNDNPPVFTKQRYVDLDTRYSLLFQYKMHAGSRK